MQDRAPVFGSEFELGQWLGAAGEQTEIKERRPDNIITSTTSGFLGVHPLMPVNSNPSRTPLTPYIPDTRRDTLRSRYEVPQTVAARHALPF